MAYAPLDEHFDEHPKYEDLELEHYGLMACAIVYCNRNLTDGKVSFKAVRGFGKSGKGPKYAKRLTEAGIWRDVESGWEIVGFLDHNPSREEVLAKREVARARKDAYRKGAPMPSVPRSVPAGQPTGQPTGQDVGRPTGQARLSHDLSLARAPAPAGAIRSAALHCTTIQEIPEPGAASTVREKPRLTAFEEPFWKAAYGETVREAVGSWSFPDRQARSIRAAIEGHCTDYANIDAWLRAKVAAFVVATRDRASYYAALGPDGFAKWLNEVSAATPRAVAAPTTSTEPEVHYPPPTPEEAAALEQALADMVDPTKRGAANVGPVRAVGEDLPPEELARLEAKRRETVARLRAELASNKPAVAS